MDIGVQLFSVRDAMERDLPGTFARLANGGYRFVETAGLHGLTPDRYRSELDNAGLRAIACHVGLSDVEERLPETAEGAQCLGAEWLVVPWVPKEVYADGWADFGRRLGEVAAACHEHGLMFAYHNHSFEFELEDGVPGFEILWNTAPSTVEPEIDLYWTWWAKHDPVAWLERLAGRVYLAHFKDGKDGRHMPIGEGELDYRRITEVAKAAGVRYAIVELDESPRDSVECCLASFGYLKSIGADA